MAEAISLPMLVVSSKPLEEALCGPKRQNLLKMSSSSRDIRIRAAVGWPDWINQ